MIVNDLKNYIERYEGFINKDICNKTIEELTSKENEFSQHTFYNQKQQVTKSL